MENQNWIPKVNEIVSWGCDAVQVMTMNFGGKVTIKMLHSNDKGKIVRNIDISELQPIC